jgi:hypothetical protein
MECSGLFLQYFISIGNIPETDSAVDEIGNWPFRENWNEYRFISLASYRKSKMFVGGLPSLSLQWSNVVYFAAYFCHREARQSFQCYDRNARCTFTVTEIRTALLRWLKYALHFYGDINTRCTFTVTEIRAALLRWQKYALRFYGAFLRTQKKCVTHNTVCNIFLHINNK